VPRRHDILPSRNAQLFDPTLTGATAETPAV